MTFNTLRFAVFFSLVYILYRLLKHKRQNILLLAASYVFYSFWDWRFLSLILASTLVNYYCGLKINESSEEGKRKAYFILAICYNLGMLGFFKYFNFFADNLRSLLLLFGWRVDTVTLNIILPLGISFYTFQAMTYPIDIYWNVIKPTKSLPDFALFVSFFPLVISGPIERARNLIPQIAGERIITRDKFYEGSWLIFWGLYKKILIADNLAKLVRGIFDNPGNAAGGVVLLAAYAFAFQVYADFSGYSDIARGLCRVMGFDVMVNFRTPFFSSNMYDFWQRWHISLTTYVKEYLYYPLALAKFYGRQIKAAIVIMIAWTIMGFWHGASWKFVLWGVYHGVALVIYNRIRPYLVTRKHKSKSISNIWHPAQALIVFNVFAIGILFFACPSMAQVLSSLQGIAFRLGQPFKFDPNLVVMAGILLVPLLLIEFFQYRTNDETNILKWPIAIRGIVYFVLLYSIIIYGDFSAQRYYYFQF